MAEQRDLRSAAYATADFAPLAALFTSEETLAAFLPQVRAFAAPDQVVERIFKGEDLFSIVMNMPIDGMVFNCGNGPVGPVAFAKGFAQIVSEA